MKSAVQLQIETPCHENWDAMTPVDHGRFCQACVKSVVDFSTMTDQQILHYLSTAKGSICGRLSDTQMNRPLIPAAQQPKTKWWYALLMPLLLVFDKANAQKTTKATKGQMIAQPADVIVIAGYATVKRHLPPTNIEVGEYCISGRVIDESGKPVFGASVTVDEWGKTVVTDTTGKYEIKTRAYADSMNISATFIGYKTDRKTLRAQSNTTMDFVLREEPNVLNDVIVIGGGRTIRCTMGGLSMVTVTEVPIKDTLLRKIGLAPSFPIYPNPVRRGQQLTLTIKEYNEFTLQVLGANGVQLFSQWYTAAKGIPQQIAVPPNWIPGIYYLRVVNEKNKKTYTEKFLVQ